MTNEFLSYARPSAPQRSSLLVGDLLSYTADIVKAHAKSKGIEVLCDPTGDLAIEVDAAQVQGAVLNLVQNATDVAPSPGPVQLSALRAGSMVQIDVRNGGGAISPSDLPRIFEPFYSTKPAGTGLGLAIARGVAQAHGGNLWVSGNQDGRVIFSMTLAADHGLGPKEDLPWATS